MFLILMVQSLIKFQMKVLNILLVLDMSLIDERMLKVKSFVLPLIICPIFDVIHSPLQDRVKSDNEFSRVSVFAYEITDSRIHDFS